MTKFEALGLSAPILRALERHQFNTPTDIQAGAIPPLLKGHDLIGLAETGTGKTAAFLLPMIDRLQAKAVSPKSGAPRALVLAPTRELASQIGDALSLLSSGGSLKSTVIYGGAAMNKQLARLKAGVDVLIATPGRLMDHVRRGSVRFDETEIFILDEADRMLDMGFVNDVKAISKALPVPHQTVLFSATINKSVEGLTKILLTEPVRVDLARKASVSEQVKHCVMHLSLEDKKTLLKKVLLDDQTGQTIIFTKTKRGADRLSRDLTKAGLKTDAIHGDRNQRQRQRTLSRFRNGSVDILIATDVAARGIDVPGIARVINFDLPLEPESYVHRVGRTGRNGATGVALSLCPPEDIGLLRDIERLLKQTIKIDADHEFHVDPPQRTGKPKQRKSRSRPPRRFKHKANLDESLDTKPVNENSANRKQKNTERNTKNRTEREAGKPARRKVQNSSLHKSNQSQQSTSTPEEGAKLKRRPKPQSNNASGAAQKKVQGKKPNSNSPNNTSKPTRPKRRPSNRPRRAA